MSLKECENKTMLIYNKNNYYTYLIAVEVANHLTRNGNNSFYWFKNTIRISYLEIRNTITLLHKGPTELENAPYNKTISL